MAACALIALAAPFNATHAANHTLSKTADVFQNGYEWVDLTVNVDWDYTAGVKHFSDNTETVDKTYIKNQIAQLACSVFVMTNGRHKLRNVYVFNKKEFGENVDIQMLNREGRAYASGFSGFGYEGFSTFNFMGMNNAPQGDPPNVIKEAFLGQVIAHELGHYFYGFADEYREDGKAADPSNPGAPVGADTPLNTIMNNHESFARLSTQADYSASTQTAQGRVYATGSNNAGASAWETLIRNPQQDSSVAISDNGHNGRRKWFAAFKDMTAPPAIASLKSDSSASSADITGYDSELKIIFKNGANAETWNSSGPVAATSRTVKQRKVILIDRTLPTATLNEAKSAAQAMLAQAAREFASNPVDYGVVVRPVQAGLSLRTTLTSTVGDINALRSSLAGITAASSGTLNLQTAYSDVRTSFLTPVDDNPVIDSIEIITRQGATAPAAVGATARKDKVALNIVGLRLPVAIPAPEEEAQENPESLSEVAEASGGEYNSAKTGAEAYRELRRSANTTQGKVFNLIDVDASEALTTSNLSKKFVFYKSAQQYDGNLVITWFYDPADASKLSFFFGRKNTTLSNATTGTGYTRDDANGTVSVIVPNSLASGAFEEWEAEARATSATTEGVDFEVASDASTASNPISLGVNLVGGDNSSLSAPVITARFGGRLPIRAGEVKVNVYRASDASLVLQDITMTDDGTGADERANDGIYTIGLTDQLPAGDFVAVIEASTVPSTSRFNPNQIQSFGNNASSQEVVIDDEIQRLAELEFTLDADASGVTPDTGGGGGGGCTVSQGQNDTSLILLVLSAALWQLWLLRRKR